MEDVIILNKKENPIYEVAVTHVDWENKVFERSHHFHTSKEKAKDEYEKMLDEEKNTEHKEIEECENNTVIIYDNGETYVTFETINL